MTFECKTKTVVLTAAAEHDSLFAILEWKQSTIGTSSLAGRNTSAIPIFVCSNSISIAASTAKPYSTTKLASAPASRQLNRYGGEILHNDHIEKFGRRGWIAQGHSLYQELAHTLFLIWNPKLFPMQRRIAVPIPTHRHHAGDFRHDRTAFGGGRMLHDPGSYAALDILAERTKHAV